MDISQKKYLIPKIQSTELKKVNKLQCTHRTPQSHLGGRRKQSQVGRKCGTWRGKWAGMWGNQGRGETDLVCGEGKGLKP